jgi:hypothetical protein
MHKRARRHRHTRRCLTVFQSRQHFPQPVKSQPFGLGFRLYIAPSGYREVKELLPTTRTTTDREGAHPRREDPVDFVVYSPWLINLVHLHCLPRSVCSIMRVWIIVLPYPIFTGTVVYDIQILPANLETLWSWFLPLFCLVLYLTGPDLYPLSP